MYQSLMRRHTNYELLMVHRSYRTDVSCICDADAAVTYVRCIRLETVVGMVSRMLDTNGRMGEEGMTWRKVRSSPDEDDVVYVLVLKEVVEEEGGGLFMINNTGKRGGPTCQRTAY